ncbi:hypothetical protein GZL_06744 [Streptomyces sp. 769]|nr:hypothetical protein GZL_06744 [Streptomyces sp. 769]
MTKGSGRHGQEGAPVVARWRGAMRRRPWGSGGAFAAVRGCRISAGAHRSTGYQAISDRAWSRPATHRRGSFRRPLFRSTPTRREHRAQHSPASYPARTLATSRPGRHHPAPATAGWGCPQR